MVPRGEQGTRDGSEYEYGNEHDSRDGSENGSVNGDKNREEDGGGRESVNLPSGNRGGSEVARVGTTPTSNQQPQPQDPTPQRDRRIMCRTRAQGREAGDVTGEGGGKAKKRKKPQKSYRHDVGNGGDLVQ